MQDLGCITSDDTTSYACAGEPDIEPNVYMQASAESMLQRLHRDRDFNVTFATWLAVLPEQGSIFQAEGMPEQELDLLQGGYLVCICT